ncbi:MAG: carboxyl transferase domain-containing protein [Pseudomonadota bacterium]
MEPDPESWESELEELRKRQELGRAMGGPEKLERQRSNSRLNVRERIDRLLDPGSFDEIGVLAGRGEYGPDGEMESFLPANYVFGRGRIDGRSVVVGGDDFTVRGGAMDASIREKNEQAEAMAGDLRLPIVRLIEGTGGGGSVKTIEMIGRTYVPSNPAWAQVAANMGLVPVVSLGLGPVAGLGAARMAASHYSVLVDGVSQMFVAGPPVVKHIGQDLTKEELGGAKIHAKNGAVDDLAASEDEAFAMARRFLSYLPSSIDDLPPRAPCDDPTDRAEDWLIRAIPKDRRKVYRMRPIIEALVDKDSFFEIGKRWGRSLITGLARLDGWPVAVAASDPYHYGGAFTADSSQKLMRFADMAQTFHLPVVFLADIPGFLVGLDAEKSGVIRHGVRALSAVHQATVPWCSIIIRKAFGVAGGAQIRHDGYRYRYAWPSGDWGSLPVEGGIEAAYKADLAASDEPEALRIEIEQRLNRVRSPFRSAEAYGIEDIIDPRETRAKLCEFANLTAKLRRTGPSRFWMRP